MKQLKHRVLARCIATLLTMIVAVMILVACGSEQETIEMFRDDMTGNIQSDTPNNSCCCDTNLLGSLYPVKFLSVR